MILSWYSPTSSKSYPDLLLLKCYIIYLGKRSISKCEAEIFTHQPSFRRTCSQPRWWGHPGHTNEPTKSMEKIGSIGTATIRYCSQHISLLNLTLPWVSILDQLYSGGIPNLLQSKLTISGLRQMSIELSFCIKFLALKFANLGD